MGDALPISSIVLATAACPSGYTRVSALDGRFLQANATYNAAAGGAASHSHANLSSHSHSVSISTAATAAPTEVARGGAAPNAPTQDGASHSHGISGTSTSTPISVPSQTVDPSYATIILCKRTS